MKEVWTQVRWVDLLRQGKSTYSFSELLRISQLSASSLHRALHRLKGKGILLKLTNGIYANTFIPPSLEKVASILYPPSYISLESALSLYGVSEQIPYLVTCVTLNKTKTFHTGLGEIIYSHLKSELFFGYRDKDGFPLAWPEKAALDFVYLQRQNGLKPTLNEWNWENLDLSKLRSFSQAFPRTVRRHLARFHEL